MTDYTVIINGDAAREILRARRWYKLQGAHLGTAFTAELVRARRDLQEAPLRWGEWRPPFRRYLLRKFPYTLYYHVSGAKITIVSLLHQHRDVNARFPEDP